MKFIIQCLLIFMGLLIFMAMPVACSSVSVKDSPATDSQNQIQVPVYSGNIYGTIVDGKSGEPLENAVIYVTPQPVRYLSRENPKAVLSDQGSVIIPDPATAVRQAMIRPDGTFLVNNIPIRGGSQLYTLIVKAPNRDVTVIDQVPVLPGASMALKIDCRMKSEGRTHIIKTLKGHSDVDINYSDEFK